MRRRDPRVATLVLSAAAVWACTLGSVVSPQPTASSRPVTPSGPAVGSSQSWPMKDMSIRPQIWFGPLDPIDWRTNVPGGTGYDFFSLFSEGAPWERAAEATRVMVLYPIWLDSASREQIQRVIDDLRRRRIAIAYECGPLTQHGQCNAGTIEGFSGPASNRRIAQNIKNAGGVLYSMEMEHGFDAATYYDPACRMTPLEIAQDASRTIAAVREVFPNVKVGSIETGNLNVDDIAAWVSAYREVTGEELAYLHLDIPYYVPDWAKRAKAIESHVRSRGIDFGIYYLGDLDDTSDEQWVGRAEQRFVEYEVVAGGQPDHAMFQSWNPHPMSLLPEDQPATFTWLITRYLRTRSALTLDLSEGVASGSLTLVDGTPLANSPIELSITPLGGQGVFADFKVTGVVPQFATTADVGLRINTECNCSGPATLALAKANYLEQGQSSNQVPNGTFASGLNGWGIWGVGNAQLGPGESGAGHALHIEAAAGQDVGLNSDVFVVTPGKAFTLIFRARVDPPTQNSGYFDIIFLNDSGESKRYTVPIQVASAVLGSAQTAADGGYFINMNGLPAGIVLLRAWFNGNEDVWPAMAGQDLTP